MFNEEIFRLKLCFVFRVTLDQGASARKNNCYLTGKYEPLFYATVCEICERLSRAAFLNRRVVGMTIIEVF